MAINAVEIDATAEELETAAKAKHWTKKEITDIAHPVGGLVFFMQDKSIKEVNDLFGTTSAWEKWGTLSLSDGSTIYIYNRVML